MPATTKRRPHRAEPREGRLSFAQMPSSGSGSRWTPFEEKALLAEYRGGKSVGQMADFHQRTELAIMGKLGLLLVEG